MSKFSFSTVCFSLSENFVCPQPSFFVCLLFVIFFYLSFSLWFKSHFIIWLEHTMRNSQLFRLILLALLPCSVLWRLQQMQIVWLTLPSLPLPFSLSLSLSLVRSLSLAFPGCHLKLLNCWVALNPILGTLRARAAALPLPLADTSVFPAPFA